MEKNEAVIAFLQTCPTIQNTSLFFNFGNVRENAHQIITRSDDVALNKPYIDGSVQKRYTFSIDQFKSIAYNPIVPDLPDENLEDFKDTQSLIDWINQQNDIRNYPQFEPNCIIDSMTVLSAKPELVGVDDTANPQMAVYRVSIQIDYVDTTHMVWH